jgi:hypothetical protein
MISLKFWTGICGLTHKPSFRLKFRQIYNHRFTDGIEMASPEFSVGVLHSGAGGQGCSEIPRLSYSSAEMDGGSRGH